MNILNIKKIIRKGEHHGIFYSPRFYDIFQGYNLPCNGSDPGFYAALLAVPDRQG